MNANILVWVTLAMITHLGVLVVVALEPRRPGRHSRGQLTGAR